MERFLLLVSGIVGQVEQKPAVAVVADLTQDRVLVVQGGKCPAWIPFSHFVVDPRGMRTGEDLERENRGF